VKGHPFEQGFDLKLWHDRLELPLTWEKTHGLFSSISMSDLFHKDIPTEYILKVFKTMRLAYWHTFQILTKRSQRLLEMDSLIPWQPNIWMGVSVENQKYTYRIDDLRKTHAQIKFLSLEPLLRRTAQFEISGKLIGRLSAENPVLAPDPCRKNG
jgi:protein gp37